MRLLALNGHARQQGPWRGALVVQAGDGAPQRDPVPDPDVEAAARIGRDLEGHLMTGAGQRRNPQHVGRGAGAGTVARRGNAHSGPGLALAEPEHFAVLAVVDHDAGATHRLGYPGAGRPAGDA